MGEVFNSKFTEVEVTVLCKVIRDYSVDNTVNVTDNVWKSSVKNFEVIHKTLIEQQENWRWDAKQIKNKWKNILADYYKVKKENATTGEVRRTLSVMSILDELVPDGSPMLNSNTIDSKADDDMSLPPPKKRKLDPVDQAIISHLTPKVQSKSDVEIKLELTKAKVDLFKSFQSKSPEEIKSVLELYNDFEMK